MINHKEGALGLELIHDFLKFFKMAIYSDNISFIIEQIMRNISLELVRPINSEFFDEVFNPYWIFQI